MIKIALADDHDIVWRGLSSLFDAEPNMVVVGEAREGQSVPLLIQNAKPDVLIIDLNLPDLPGLEIIRRVRSHTPYVKIVVYSMYSELPYITGAFKGGATAYVSKDVAPKFLVNAVRASIENKRTVFTAEIEADVVWQTLNQMAGIESPTDLTSRQREVLVHWAQGDSTKETAVALGIQPRTVEKHRENIRKRLHLRNQADASLYAIRQGLVVVETEPGTNPPTR
ncbi:MAG: response regulator transcription factor [Chloroflexi bacterium]|nr:response regulator transcription factor [Chloroflexota bacterium]